MSKILIIEDEAAIRRVLVKILSEENTSYIVSEAEDGLQGIELIKKEDFDMTQMRDKFKAPSNKYSEGLFLDEDPKELFPAINEIAYNVSEEGKNIINNSGLNVIAADDLDDAAQKIVTAVGAI